MSKTIRIRTTPNGDDKFIKINMEQDFDFVEILSLKISQKELYTTFCAGYGAIVGRVSVNGGFGVQNAKVSVFIPVSELDRENDKIFGLYPFETISDLGPNGLRYNLLSKENQTNDDCFTPVGDFLDKRTFLDSDTMLDIYCEYYKFTTTTNAAGDYMLFGVPTGAQIMHAEADVSDIGVISQKPFDFIRKGASDENFESTTKFRGSEEDLDFNLQIIKQSPISVNVQPYWGDEDNCNVAITRRDIDFKAAITPQAIFMGSIFGDNEYGSVNIQCRPSSNMGTLNDQTAGTGKIEMVRKTLSGNIERFDVGGAQLIDSDGTWAYQVPMNLDYRVTDEYGNLVPTDDPKRGIPTRAKVRFRIKMNTTGGEGNLRERASYLVPNNPLSNGNVKGRAAYEFGPNTREEDLAELVWNGVYSVKNFIRRVQKTEIPSTPTERTFLGIKDVDSARGKYTPFPYNHLNFQTASMFGFICGLTIIISSIIILINLTLIQLINQIIGALNSFLDAFGIPLLPYIPCITVKCETDNQARLFAPGCCSGGQPFPCTNSYGCDAAAENEGQTVYCIGSDPDNAFGDTLPPGDAGYTNCVALGLAQDLNLFQFDFYNDWVNGTLYSPLFKVRIKDGDSSLNANGPHQFCEWSSGGNPNDLSVDNDNNGFDNPDYNDLYIIDSCAGNSVACGQNGGPDCGVFNLGVVPPINRAGIKRTSSNLIKNGLIVYYDNEYYYSSALRDFSDLVLATDIITLGSSVRCHWLGLPSVYYLFIDTTYKLPPYLRYEENNTPLVNGMDSLSSTVNDSLFFEINCFFTRTNARTCGNIRRQCELGIGLDEARPNNPLIISNPRINQDDIDVRFTRNVFAWMNDQQLQLLYSSPLDSQINFDVDTTPSCGSQNGSDDYNRFRYHWVDTNNRGTLCNLMPATYNSFYFYFGLNRNKTALSKMLSKYFAPCPIKDRPDFLIIGDTTDSTFICNNVVGNGEIDVTIQGGTAPYTYFWTYPDNTQFTITGNTNPTLDAVDLEDLCGGAYVLTVVDTNGLSSTITFIVGEPQPVACITQTVPVSSQGGNDGMLNVFINGGLAPYDMTVTGPNGYNQQFSNLPAGQEIINNLFAGQYTATITDSNGDISTCTAEVEEPSPLTILINHNYIPGPLSGTTNNPDDPDNYEYNYNTQDDNNADVRTNVTCNGDTDGLIRVSVFGGVPPYSATTSPNTNNISPVITYNPAPSFTFSPLAPNTYTVTVEDNQGNIEQITVIVGQPPVFEVGDIGSFIQPTIAQTTINVIASPFLSQNGGEQITYYLYDSTGNTLIEEVTVQQDNYTFAVLTQNTTYQIAARNEAGCYSNSITLTTLP